jgi:hypothetical protein
LAPPGAGLPKLELFVARLLFRLRRRTGNSKSFTTLFQNEREKIRELVAICPMNAANVRVLIERVPGLEDSSRYWSVWMTLDHLRIVNGQIARVIQMLLAGKVPPGTASTAAVKPSPDVSGAVRDAYEASCTQLFELVRTEPNLNTRVRYAHPWFGPLDGSGWHALAGGHMRIHRVQLERILAGLAQSSF